MTPVAGPRRKSGSIRSARWEGLEDSRLGRRGASRWRSGAAASWAWRASFYRLRGRMEGTWDAAPLLFPEEMEKPEVGLAASGLFASRVEAVERESTTVSAREQASLSLNVGDTSPLVDVERPQSRPTSLPEAGGSCGGAEQSGAERRDIVKPRHDDSPHSRAGGGDSTQKRDSSPGRVHGFGVDQDCAARTARASAVTDPFSWIVPEVCAQIALAPRPGRTRNRTGTTDPAAAGSACAGTASSEQRGDGRVWGQGHWAFILDDQQALEQHARAAMGPAPRYRA